MKRLLSLATLLFAFLLILPISSAIGASGSLSWSVDLQFDEYSHMDPAYRNGVIYIGSSNGKFYAVNRNGQILWSIPMTTIIGPPTIDNDGTIYVSSTGEGVLYAVNPDGTIKWKFDVGDEVDGGCAIDSDGTIYFSTMAGKLIALDKNGNEKWEEQLGSGYLESPVIGSSGTIYVASVNGMIYAVNPDGSTKWSYNYGAPIFDPFAIAADGTIYAVGDNDETVALNPDGTLKWKTNIGNTQISPVIGSDGTVYILTDRGVLNALNPANGSIKWSVNLGNNAIYSTPAVGSDGWIYVGITGGTLFAISPDGSIKWTITTGGDISSSVLITPDGLLCFGCNDGKLYAVQLSGGGLADSPWPMYRRNPQHIGRLGSTTSNGGGGSSGGGGTLPFSDISDPNYSYATQSIVHIYNAGITQGCGDGKYCPGDTVTRDQMAAFLARALHLNTGTCITQPFYDVPVNSWFCPYVEAIKNAGITQGYGNGYYGPYDPVNRAQMAVFLDRAFLSENYGGNSNNASLSEAANVYNIVSTTEDIPLTYSFLTLSVSLPFVNTAIQTKGAQALSSRVFVGNPLEGFSLPKELKDAVPELFSNVAKTRAAQDISGSSACTGSGTYSYTGTYDPDTGYYNLTYNFQECLSGGYKINGTLWIKGTYSSPTADVELSTNNLQIIHYDSDNTPETIYSTDNLNIKATLNIGLSDLSLQFTINGYLAEQFSQFTTEAITSDFKNFSVSLNMSIDSTGNTSYSSSTNGDIEFIAQLGSLKLNYNNFQNNTITLSGTVGIATDPPGTCGLSNETFTFNTTEPINTDPDTGTLTSGSLNINNTYQINWNNGNIQVSKNNTVIFSGAESTLEDHTCPLLSDLAP